MLKASVSAVKVLVMPCVLRVERNLTEINQITDSQSYNGRLLEDRNLINPLAFHQTGVGMAERGGRNQKTLM